MVSEETREKMRRSQQLRRMKKPAAVALREGDMVVCPDGTIGLLSELRAIGLSQVQFGAARSGGFRGRICVAPRRSRSKTKGCMAWGAIKWTNPDGDDRSRKRALTPRPTGRFHEFDRKW
jgi:hypothetical protein